MLYLSLSYLSISQWYWCFFISIFVIFINYFNIWYITKYSVIWVSAIVLLQPFFYFSFTFTSTFHWKCPFLGQQWSPLCYNKFVSHSSVFSALLYHWTKLTAPSPLKHLLGFRHPALSWFFYLIPLQPFSVFASSSPCPWFLYIGTFLLQSLTPVSFLSPSLLTLLVMSYSFFVLMPYACNLSQFPSPVWIISWLRDKHSLGSSAWVSASNLARPKLSPCSCPLQLLHGLPQFFDWQVLPFSDSGLNIWSLPWLLVLPCLTSNPFANSLVSLPKSQSHSFFPLGLLDHTTRGPRLDDGCCFPSWSPVWSQQSSQEIPLKQKCYLLLRALLRLRPESEIWWWLAGPNMMGPPLSLSRHLTAPILHSTSASPFSLLSAECVVEIFLRASALVLPLFAAPFSGICLSFSLMPFRFLLSCHLLSQAFPGHLLKIVAISLSPFHAFIFPCITFQHPS